MVFQCVTTYSNFRTISQTEYTSLSQQSAMSVLKRAGFLSPDLIPELVWDHESEEAGASNDCIIHLCNRIFRQPLKYLYFIYSFLDEVRKYRVEILDSPLEKHTGKDNDTGTNFNKRRSFSVQDGVACKYRGVWKIVSKVLRKYVCVK
jgi:hypothetical protein